MLVGVEQFERLQADASVGRLLRELPHDGTDGAAVAMLTGTTGTSPTVTASVAASDKETITETTVVHF